MSDSSKPSPIHAVVTGSSSGIGREIAIQMGRRFGGQGLQLLVHYRKNASGARETQDALRDLGVDSSLVQADLRDPADRRRLIQQSYRSDFQANTWVNNAGADVLTGSASELSFAEKIRLLMETDVLSTIELSREVADRMKATLTDAVDPVFPGSFTFIGWDQAAHGMEGDAGQMFGPVKAAVMAFANSFAQELAPMIRVNTIAPGWIRTAWGQNTDSYWDQRARGQSLMNRWGSPADVAHAVCFAVDPANTFLTGQTIDVNGGWNRRFGESK